MGGEHPGLIEIAPGFGQIGETDPVAGARIGG